MIHSVIAVLIIALTSTLAIGQLDGATTLQAVEGTPESKAKFPGKPELLRRIGLYEAAARNADSSNASPESLVKIYTNLGSLYEDVAMYPKSEDAMRRAISLLKTGPQDALAEEIGHLAVLHDAMGQLREAEKDQMQALRIRESIGDIAGIALTWSDVADLYIKRRRYKKALSYAQRAMDALGDRPDVSAGDRVAVRQTLASALSGTRDYPRAIQLLKDAIELSKNSFGADSLEVGLDDYILGYTYWKSGNMTDAEDWMGRGIMRMKVDLGWGHAIYVNAIWQYAQFLRQNGQTDAAVSAEREVRQAQAVVDARTFTDRSGDFRIAASQ